MFTEIAALSNNALGANAVAASPAEEISANNAAAQVEFKRNEEAPEAQGRSPCILCVRPSPPRPSPRPPPYVHHGGG